MVYLACIDFMPALRGSPQGWIRDLLHGHVEEPWPVYLSSKQGMNVSAELDFAMKEKLLSVDVLRKLKQNNIVVQGFYHVSKWYVPSLNPSVAHYSDLGVNIGVRLSSSS